MRIFKKNNVPEDIKILGIAIHSRFYKIAVRVFFTNFIKRETASIDECPLQFNTTMNSAVCGGLFTKMRITSI